MLIKSREALDWQKAAIMQIPASAKVGAGSKTELLAISFWVRYESRRPDLSVELILDTLERAGVVSNDRWVYETHAYKEIDPDNPGVEVLIEEAIHQ